MFNDRAEDIMLIYFLSVKMSHVMNQSYIKSNHGMEFKKKINK